MARCMKCGKNFDEEMYCHICPKCGTYNRPKEKYDINQYFTTNTDGSEKDIFSGEKYSTQKQAQETHEKLHRMYEHTSVREAHEKQSTAYQETFFERPKPSKQDNYPKSEVVGREIFEQEKKSAPKRKKPVFLIVCILIMAVTILCTVIYCKFAYFKASQTAMTLSFDTQEGQMGEAFELDGRQVCVDHLKQIDTSVISGFPTGEKLIAVYLDVDNQDMGWKTDSETIYIYDGTAYKEPVSTYKLDMTLPSLGLQESELLTSYGYLHSDVEDGYFLFFVDKEATRGEITFEEQEMRDHVRVITKRVTVPVVFEE